MNIALGCLSMFEESGTRPRLIVYIRWMVVRSIVIEGDREIIDETNIMETDRRLDTRWADSYHLA